MRSDWLQRFSRWTLALGVVGALLVEELRPPPRLRRCSWGSSRHPLFWT
jgi:hypothetical protein